MLIISLKTFAQTGQFGFVTIGMHKSQVLQLLGKPDADSINEVGGIDILLYGWYEFFFFDKHLIGIQNESLDSYPHPYYYYHTHNPTAFSNTHFRVSTWFMNGRKQQTYKNVIFFLEKEKMIFEERIEYGLVFLYLQSGVSFDFLDENGDYYLDDKGKRRYPKILKKEAYLLVGIRYHPRL